MKTEQFKLAGMGCANCGKTIQNTLNDLSGVKEALVNYEDNVAKVTYEPQIVTPEGLSAAVRDAGYQLLID